MPQGYDELPYHKSNYKRKEPRREYLIQWALFIFGGLGLLGLVALLDHFNIGW